MIANESKIGKPETEIFKIHALQEAQNALSECCTLIQPAPAQKKFFCEFNRLDLL